MSVTILVFILAYQLLAYFYEVVVENTMVNFYNYFSIHFSLSTIGLLLWCCSRKYDSQEIPVSFILNPSAY